MNLIFYFCVFFQWSLFFLFSSSTAFGKNIPSVQQSTALELNTLEGKTFSFSETEKNKASVFIFLSPECPLCHSYTLTLKNLHQKYDSLNIKFYGVFPGKYYSKKQIRGYVKKYGVKFTMLLDTEYKLTNYLKATITPEAFLLDAQGGIKYSGKIDNWVYELGKKRTIITEFYLQDAIVSVLKNTEIKIKKTEAIGCFIFAMEKNE